MSNGAFTVGETQAIDYTVGVELGGPAVHRTVPQPGAGRHPARDLRRGGRRRFAGPAGQQQGGPDGLRRRLHHPGGPAVAAVWNSPSGTTRSSCAGLPAIPWTPTGKPLPPDSPLRSPEHHISEITGREDFQGYRIYRYQGEIISGIPRRCRDPGGRVRHHRRHRFRHRPAAAERRRAARVRRHRSAGRLPLLVLGDLLQRPGSAGGPARVPERLQREQRAGLSRVRRRRAPANPRTRRGVPQSLPRRLALRRPARRAGAGPQDLVHRPAGALPHPGLHPGGRTGQDPRP